MKSKSGVYILNVFNLSFFIVFSYPSKLNLIFLKTAPPSSKNVKCILSDSEDIDDASSIKNQAVLCDSNKKVKNAKKPILKKIKITDKRKQGNFKINFIILDFF